MTWHHMQEVQQPLFENSGDRKCTINIDRHLHSLVLLCIQLKSLPTVTFVPWSSFYSLGILKIIPFVFCSSEGFVFLQATEAHSS